MTIRHKSKHPWLLTAAVGVALLTGSGQAAADDSQKLPELKINAAKAELGKRLFFDTRLSGDAAISCATCHQPEHGYSTPDALAPGYPGNKHFRNSPTLINSAHKKVWFHDGHMGTNLNDVTREMITEDFLMNMDMRLMQERIKQDPIYVKMFKDAGYGEPSNGSVRKAIPEYLKTLTSRNAPFDAGTMSDAAKRGQALFEGKAGCNQCHNGPLFLDGEAHNTGVAENFDVFRDPLRHQAFIAYNMFMGNENYMNLKRDVGAHVQSHKADGSDIGKFMTPTLRELKYTAPYMHNGTLQTLQEVVSFYNGGGGEDSQKSELIKPLNLSVQEQRDLVAFLESLSGDQLNTAEHVWEKKDYSYQLIENWREARN